MRSKAKRSQARSCSMHQFVRRAIPCMSLLLVTTLPGVALSVDHALAVDLAIVDGKVDALSADHATLAADLATVDANQGILASNQLIIFDFLVPALNANADHLDELWDNFMALRGFVWVTDGVIVGMSSAH